MDGTVGAGRYVLMEQIGEGGMASVWRCIDGRLGVERAVKLATMRSASLQVRFDREARLMARLEHPHVVPVHDLGEEGDQLWMVMSLFRRGSVAEHVERFGPLPPRQAVSVADGVLQALAAAHVLGVIHRDVKPQNVLIDDLGAPRLGDFGIARVEAPSLTRTGAVLGTPAYMSPEQRTSSREVGPPSDLYAVGALLASILLAELPGDLFHRPSFELVSARLPEPLIPFVLRCTEFVPADRFGSAAAALDALRAAAEALPPDPLSTVPLGAGGERPRTPPVVGLLSTVSSLVPPAEPTTPFASEAPPRRSVTALVVAGGSLVASVIAFLGCGLGAAILGPTLYGDWADAGAVPEPAVEAPMPVPEPAAPEPAPAPAPAPVALPRVEPRPVRPAAPTSAPAPAPTPIPSGPNIRVSASPSATLDIDGQRKGATPWEGPLPAGEHQVELRREGQPVFRRVIHVAEGGPAAYCWDLVRGEPCLH